MEPLVPFDPEGGLRNLSRYWEQSEIVRMRMVYFGEHEGGWQAVEPAGA